MPWEKKWLAAEEEHRWPGRVAHTALNELGRNVAGVDSGGAKMLAEARVGQIPVTLENNH